MEYGTEWENWNGRSCTITVDPGSRERLIAHTPSGAKSATQQQRHFNPATLQVQPTPRSLSTYHTSYEPFFIN
jgi:hypothetical protein